LNRKIARKHDTVLGMHMEYLVLVIAVKLWHKISGYIEWWLGALLKKMLSMLRTLKRRGGRSYLRGNREPIILRTLRISVVTCVSVYLGVPQGILRQTLGKSQKRPAADRHNQYLVLEYACGLKVDICILGFDPHHPVPSKPTLLFSIPGRKWSGGCRVHGYALIWEERTLRPNQLGIVSNVQLGNGHR
jgi:hypothetical protein